MKVKARPGWDHPFDTPTFWINHASRLIMRTFERRLRPLGLGMAYLPVLLALEESEPLTQKDLVASARVEQPTMAALLARMERDGVIARARHPNDQRATMISLTAKARGRLAKAKEQLRQAADEATSGLSERERATLRSALERVVTNLGGRVTADD